MSDPWPRSETLSVARTALLRKGAVTDGFHGVDVAEENGQLLVAFRWSHDPDLYAVAFPMPGRPPRGVCTGEIVPSVEDWIREVGFRLTEELETGMMCRQRERRPDGVIPLRLSRFDKE